jgi:hypothetical protein
LRPRRLFGFSGSTGGVLHSPTIFNDPGRNEHPPATATPDLSESRESKLQGRQFNPVRQHQERPSKWAQTNPVWARRGESFNNTNSSMGGGTDHMAQRWRVCLRKAGYAEKSPLHMQLGTRRTIGGEQRHVASCWAIFQPGPRI